MSPLAVFGITNDGLNLAVNLLLLVLVVIWLALVFWTHSDARRRISDPMLVGCATAASLFPFAGTIVYMIVRPPEYLDDVRERELEIAAAEARLHSIEAHTCPYCENEVEKSFLRCPHCLRRLKEPCTTCGKPLDPRWKICPYCEADVPGQQPAPRRPAAGEQRRRAEGAAPRQAPAKRQASAPARPATAAATPPRTQAAPRPVDDSERRTQRPAQPADGAAARAQRQAQPREQRKPPPRPPSDGERTPS